MRNERAWLGYAGCVTIFVRSTKAPFLRHGYYNKCLDEEKFCLEIVLDVWALKRWLVWTKG